MAVGEGKNRRQTTVGKGDLDGGCGLPRARSALAMTWFSQGVRYKAGRRAEGTGGTDCHSQCAHRLRNDTVNKRCGASPGGPMWGAN